MNKEKEKKDNRAQKQWSMTMKKYLYIFGITELR